MKNKIFYFIPILAIALAVIWIGSREPVELEVTDIIDEEKKPLIGEPEAPEQTLPLANDPKTLAWNLFQKYVGFNKARDLDGVKSVVYKIAAVCLDPKTRIDCEARMGAAYEYGSALKKEDFVNVWSDERQTILVTDFWTEESSAYESIGRFRSIIFFVKDDQGVLKLLSFTPSQGGATSKGSASDAELQGRIVRWTEDNDKDGLADYGEECLATNDSDECTKTNPRSRDTDSDGLWDGTEFFMSK